MAGVVVWLRVAGRGRRVWEPVTLVTLACLPPVWVCVQLVFHPQDLLTLGLSLAAMACACRGKWIGAGILVALAILSQQFALLVAVPLLMLAPARRRIPFVAAGLVTGVMVDIPFLAATSGHALRSITLGTGDTPSIGGTVLWELHLSGAPLVLFSRVAPLAVSVVLSWWIARRLGLSALAPTPLLSLVAVSLALRLVFEQNIFVYYFMALAVCAVLLDVTRGYVRQATVAWLARGGVGVLLHPGRVVRIARALGIREHALSPSIPDTSRRAGTPLRIPGPGQAGPLVLARRRRLHAPELARPLAALGPRYRGMVLAGGAHPLRHRPGGSAPARTGSSRPA